MAFGLWRTTRSSGLGEQGSYVEAAATALLPREVAKLLAPLRAREREILTLRFGLDGGEPRTVDQVGHQFNLTRERIRQLLVRAMSKLRHPAFNPPDTT